MYRYDVLVFKKITEGSNPKHSFGVSIQRRFAIAGAADKRTTIDISRVDEFNVFPEDEDAAATAVTRAADINVGNIIGTADEIKGLGVFENSKLAVFTNDQVVIYDLHPDLTQWQINDKSNVNVGTLSHNTIATAGSDIMFCSRY